MHTKPFFGRRRAGLFTALGLATLASAFPATADERSAVFVLDASGSMWGRLTDGQTKIGAAKSVLGALLEDTPQTVSVGLMAYGHRRKNDCGDIELLQQPVAGGAAGAGDLVRRLSPKGKTPISDSLVAAAKALAAGPGKRTLVLVSDGIETCGGDPCAVAKSLAAADASLTIHVVGYDVEPAAARQLSCVAENGRGQYFSADDADRLKTALTAVGENIVKNAPLPAFVEAPPPPKVEAPSVAPMSFGKRISIAGPGTIKLKLAAWATPPRYWKLLDPETGDEVATISAQQTMVKPGSYQIGWRQVEHGAREVALPLVITVGPGETVEATIDTGIRLVAPEGMKKPYYYQLLTDEADLEKWPSEREPAAWYSIWDPAPVPPGDYTLVFRQSEHGHTEVNLGRIELKKGELTDVVLDQGINFQWPAEWAENSVYYLKATDEAGHDMKFSYRGSVVLAPGKYTLAFRLKEHGWSEADWGEIEVPQSGFADAGLTSGIIFLSLEKKPRHRIYAVNLDTGKEASIVNHWGPFPLPLGRYRLDYQPERGERFTIAEEVEILAGTMLEARM